MPRPYASRLTIHYGIWIGCLLATMPASAGQITLLGGKTPAIGISGPIVAGDETAFHGLVATAPNALIVLTSPGGSVDAAIAIGLEIRARGLRTLVPAGANCASACSLIWLAGTTRMLGTDALIGLHAICAWYGVGRACNETHVYDPVLTHYLLALGYAGDATAMIVHTPTLSIRRLNRIELNAAGFAAESFP